MGTVLKLRKNQIIPTPGGVAVKKFLFHGKKNICGDRIRMARCCFANKLRKFFKQSAKKKRRLKGF